VKQGDAQRWLAAIVESSDDGVIGEKLDGTIVSWNAAATRIYGYTASEMIGQPVLKLVPPDLVDEERTIVARLVRGERVEPYETRRRTKDGRTIDVSLSVAPILDGTGAIIGASKVARDITREKQTRDTVQQRNAELEARAAELDERLRESTRLSLALEESNAQLNKALGTARTAQLQAEDANRALLSSLVDFAKLDAGKLALELKDVPVDEILTRIEPLVRPQARARSQKLRIEIPAESMVVRADAERSIQVLRNLLSNAIKFTPLEGSISVEARKEADMVSIRVQDSGPGITDVSPDHIFEPFVQLERSLARNHGGAGLGLAISRDLARAMQGDVVFEPHAGGQGATFVFRIPRVS